MQKPDPSSSGQLLQSRIDELRNELRNRDVDQLCLFSGAAIYRDGDGGKKITMQYWHKEIEIILPQFIARDPSSGEALNNLFQALLMYYLTTADGTPLTGRWISFAELPDGKFYQQAFQGYTGRLLEKNLAHDMNVLYQVAIDAGGNPYKFGDTAFLYKILPRVNLLVVFWQGDDDFPSRIQILFDAAASHYLPTDGYAIVGSILTSRLISAAKKSKGK